MAKTEKIETIKVKPTPIVTFMLFFMLMGVVMVGVQMMYNSALEYGDMRRTCEEFDLLPLENGSIIQKPVKIRNEYSDFFEMTNNVN